MRILRRKGASASRVTRVRTAVVGALFGAVSLVTASTVFAVASGASPSLTATFVKTSDWGTGYIADFNLLNGPAVVASWTLSFDLPAGQQITNEWNGNMSQHGNSYVITNGTWDGYLGPGSGTAVGIQVSYSGAYSPPTNCLIDSNPCQPTSPTTTIVPTTTTTVATTTTVPPTTTTTTTPGAGTGLSATFQSTSRWNGGYIGKFTISNSGAAVHSWSLGFALPASQTLGNYWNGNLTGNGTSFVVTNEDWNGTIASGGTATVGIQVVVNGAYSPPTGCTIDSQPCSSGPPPTTTTTPTTSTTTTVPATTTTVPATTTLPGPPGGAYAFAPYVDTTVDSPPFSLVGDSKATGTNYFTLAFIVGDGACQASWGGYYTVASGYYGAQISALKTAGGNVIISFGGAAGTELADSCSSVSALQAQYQSVINEYGVTHLDFDIEGADLTNTVSLQRRFAAIAAVEVANPSLSVSVTLPVLPTGLTANDLTALRMAAGDGVIISVLNILAMDYGGAVSNPAGQMGTFAIDAATAVEGQLVSLYPLLTPAAAWAMIGVTPMIGINDYADEIFGLDDASALFAFAKQSGIGRLSMWAATRDVECPGGAALVGSDTCSGITQQPYAFSDVFSSYP